MQLGVVLERYPDNVITDVTSPVTGIQRRSTWPPSIADIVKACDAEVERLARLQKLAAAGEVKRREPAVPVHRANVFIPASAPQYAAMVDRANNGGDTNEWRAGDKRPGIWVALNWVLGNSEQPTRWRRFTADELEFLYDPAKADERLAAGREPEAAPDDRADQSGGLAPAEGGDGRY